MDLNQTEIPPPSKSQGHFPETLWTQIAIAQTKEDLEGQRAAIEALCERYHRPILGWLIRKGNSEETARDLCQEFTYRFFTTEKLCHFKRDGFRFRSFLCRCLENFSRDEWRKKDPLRNALSSDDEDAPIDFSAKEQHIDKSLDRLLAKEIHSRALDRLRTQFSSDLMRPRLSVLEGLILERGEDYQNIARQLGTTETNVKQMMRRFREGWIDAFTAEVSEFTDPSELAGELRYLISLLAE